MVFLMPVCAYPEISGSDTPDVKVLTAETILSGNDYILNANIDFQLSHKATEALRNGVPLFWTYQFKVEEQNNLLWNTTLIEKSFMYRIQYHALLNMYRVRNESYGTVENFSTLQAALDMLSTLKDFHLIEKASVDENKNHVVGIKITFERDALPLPLRPVAYLSPQWYLSSDWYLWPLKK